MFQTNETSGLYFFYLFGKNPEKFYSENFLPRITKAPGAGS